MQYLLLIHHDEQAWNALGETEKKQIYTEYRQLMEDIQASGQYLSGSQVKPASTSKSVRVRDGKRLITDGPFAETREQLGGYFLIEVKDLEDALGIAARIPSARMGAIEVRALERGAPS